jgi:UDP-2,3-diacylglucosamine hydrolase
LNSFVTLHSNEYRLTPRTKIYFASDFHLGVPDYESSLKREKRIVSWLEEAGKDASEIFLMGDVFDFWFEYSKVVPRGFVRILGKIAELTDSGIKVHYFTGNHDIWVFDYLPKETGVTVYREPIIREFGGKKFYLGHGDGLGPYDKGFKFLKKIYTSALPQWLFARIHPNLGLTFAHYWSKKSRISNGSKDETFHGEDKEWLVLYSKDILRNQHIDYFIFGHRHLPLDIRIGDNSRYVNLGEWVNYETYAVFDGQNLELKSYK